MSEEIFADGDRYQHAPCGLLRTSIDGQILHANAWFCTRVGISLPELIETTLLDLLDPGARIFYETRLLPILQLQGEVSEITLSLRTADGSMLPVLFNAVLDQNASHGPQIHVAVFAASERQSYERQLLTAQREAEASARRTLILQNAITAFGESRTVEQLAGALVHSAQAAAHPTAAAVFLTEVRSRLIAGTVPVDAAILPGGLPAGAETVDTARIWSLRDHAALELSDAAAADTGEVSCVLTVPLHGDGRPVGTLACYFTREPDLDERRLDLLNALGRQAAQTLARLQLQAQLAAIALYDPLTGLANRFLLRTHITAAVSAAIDREQPLALLFVDLDDFKSINDELDHAAGDTVLKLVAARLTATVRSEDLVCRYGGDEFIIVCENTDQDRAAAIAERVRVAIKQPLYADGWQRTVTASVGVTVHTPTYLHSGPELLRLADKAMYRSKNHGKDQVTVLTH